MDEFGQQYENDKREKAIRIKKLDTKIKKLTQKYETIKINIENRPIVNSEMNMKYNEVDNEKQFMMIREELNHVKKMINRSQLAETKSITCSPSNFNCKTMAEDEDTIGLNQKNHLHIKKLEPEGIHQNELGPYTSRCKNSKSKLSHKYTENAYDVGHIKNLSIGNVPKHQRHPSEPLSSIYFCHSQDD